MSGVRRRNFLCTVDSVGKFVHFDLDIDEVDPGPRVVGRNRGCLFQQYFGVLVSLGLQGDSCQESCCVYMIRVLCEDFPVNHLRGLGIPAVFEILRPSQLFLKRHLLRDSAAFRRFSIAPPFEHIGAVDLVMDTGVRRIESNDFFVSRACLSGLAFYQQDIAERLVRERKIGKKAERLLDTRFCDREFAQRKIHPGRQAQEIAVIRIFFQILVAKLCRHLQVPGPKLRQGVVELPFLFHSRSSSQDCAKRQTVLVPFA